MARCFDERVGYDTDALVDFGTDGIARARAHHQPVPPREEGSERGGVRTGQADRVLRRSGTPANGSAT